MRPEDPLGILVDQKGPVETAIAAMALLCAVHAVALAVVAVTMVFAQIL